MFVPEEIVPLRCAVAEVWSLGEVSISSHHAAFPANHTAYLYGLGVYAEVVLATIHLPRHTAAYMFLKAAYCLTTVIELAARDEVRSAILAFLQPCLKQSVLTVYLLRLSCHAQSDDFQVGKTGHWARMRNISFIRDQTMGDLRACLQKLYELCVQVAHWQTVSA